MIFTSAPSTPPSPILVTSLAQMSTNKSWPLVRVKSVYSSSSEQLSPPREASFPPQIPDDIKSWPTETHTLEERHKDWTVIAYDTILIILPVGLVAKAIIVAAIGNSQQGGQDVDTVPQIIPPLVEFNGQMVTLFTVVFTTIVATLVRRYALWKSQKGATVAELEQLHSSTSLAKTLGLVWSLGSWTATSIWLILIWYVVEPFDSIGLIIKTGPGIILARRQHLGNCAFMIAQHLQT
jgi:hypothetical protein